MLMPRNGRPARPAPAAWNIAKTLFQTVLFWGFFLFLLPAAIYWLEDLLGLTAWRFARPASAAGGAVLFVVAGSLGITSGMVMAVAGKGTPVPTDCPREMVVAGPYRYVRNPMALAGLAQGVAAGIFLGSPLVIAYALAGGPFWNYLVRPWEEADLEQRFGDSFRRYRAHVRCWWPRLTPYRPVPAEGRANQ
jgi:protein-S-isoprenylcysteine O-methyltransferase Ste14